MVDKLETKEIIEIFKKQKYKFITTDEMLKLLLEERKTKNLSEISRTTIHNRLKDLELKRKIANHGKQGYYLIIDEYLPADFKYVDMLKEFSKIELNLFKYNDNIKPNDEIPNVFKDIYTEFKSNLNDLENRGIITYINKDRIVISRKYAEYLDICPVCYEKVNISEKFLKFQLINDSTDIIEEVYKVHLKCGLEFRNRDKYKENTKKESKENAKKERFSLRNLFKKVKNVDLSIYHPEVCEKCGLPLFVETIIAESEFTEKDEDILKPILNTLYEDDRIYFWINQIIDWYVKINNQYYRYDIAIIEQRRGKDYHPKCAKNISGGGE